MIAAALAAMPIARVLAFGTVITLGPVTGLAAAIVMVVTIWIPSPWLAGLCFFLIGAGPMLWVISTTTLRQTVTPSHALGRVSAIMVTATSGSRPIGAAIGALVGAAYGAETCIVVAALGFLVQAAPDPDLAHPTSRAPARRRRLTRTPAVTDVPRLPRRARRMVEYAP